MEEKIKKFKSKKIFMFLLFFCEICSADIPHPPTKHYVDFRSFSQHFEFKYLFLFLFLVFGSDLNYLFAGANFALCVILTFKLIIVMTFVYLLQNITDVKL